MKKQMKRVLAVVIMAAMVIGFIPIMPAEVHAEGSSDSDAGRTVLNMNQDWGFYRGDLEGAEAVGFDDSGFVNVTIPHTMELEKKHCNGGTATYKGIGWYRRYFEIDESYQGKKINLDFEGVMTDSDIYLNGEKLYTRNGGYMGFSVDISDKVKFGETNVLAVKVSSEDSPDSPPGKPEASLDFHYYGGIYRDVTMTITENVHITNVLQEDEVAGGGIFVTYQDVSKESAKVNVKTHVKNESDATQSITVKQILNDKEGNKVQETSSTIELAAGAAQHMEQQMTVTSPKLWGVDDPYLYSLVTEIECGSTVVDSVTTKIGIRTIEFKADGFYLNGEHVYLRGANRHQSYQNVGDAAPDSMQYRDALQLKENGFNAVRATHYPQDPAFLDACDELGLLVIECQPGWQNFTNTQTFYDNTMRDIKAMIRRDRNRPSVILWESSLNETWCPSGWAEEAVTTAHAEYPGNQLYTAADYGANGALYDVCYKVQDTQWSDNPSDWKDFDPEKPFLTREWGDYESSSKALRKDGEAAMNQQVQTRQRYLNGNGYSDWGGLDASDRIGGYFLWSWNDYSRGSTNYTLGSGTVDIDRYEKNDYYWLQSMQPADNPVYGAMVYISSYYTEDSGLNIPVYSNCDSVRLYQNGNLVKEISKAEAGASVPNIIAKGGSPIYEFTLDKFESGELKAEGVVDGKVVCEHTVRTPGNAVKLEIEVRERGITPIADGSDLVPVYIKAVDENGTVVPDYLDEVKISVTGAGTLVGENIPRIGVEEQRLEGGIGFAFVRTADVAGEINITASAEGLMDGTASITTAASQDKFVPDGTHEEWTQGEDGLEGEWVNYKNVAVGKPVAASTEQSSNGNLTKNAVDNDESTRWCASGGEFPQWIQIDLEKAYAISGFQILWENPSDTYQYNIEVSKDGETWETVVDKSGQSEANGAAETQLVETEGRFVRLNIQSARLGWASLYELRVIPNDENDEADPGDVIPDEMIASIEASAPSEEGRDTDRLRDGITGIGTGWLSTSKDFPQSVTVTFKEPQTLLGSRIYWEKDSSWYTYDLEVTSDGETWNKIFEDYTVGGQHFKAESFEEVQKGITAVRVTIKGIQAGGDYNVGMAEWILYGVAAKGNVEPEKEYEYLSDLEWESAGSDYGQVTKDAPAYNANIITLNTEEGVKEFAKGLGADTNSEIVYNIEGKNFAKFESYIGINTAASKNGGEAIFKVYLDDKEAYVSPVKMRDDTCSFVSLDVTGVKKIRLVAGWNDNPDNIEARYNTHIVWADAKLYYAVDKTGLENAVKAAKAKDLRGYTEESAAAYNKIIKDAEAVLENEEATKEEVADALKKVAEAEKVLVKKEEPEPPVTKLPYTDVTEEDWFYPYVKDVYESALMTGLKDTIFGPTRNLARAQFAVILYRMEGEPEVEYTAQFPDVADEVWYTDAILWAAKAGVVTGYTDTGKFGPADEITREQMAVMMYRYAKYKKYDISESKALDDFRDAEKVNGFAVDAMKWCAAKEIIKGDKGNLNPQGSTNRAECAAIISRFDREYRSAE